MFVEQDTKNFTAPSCCDEYTGTRHSQILCTLNRDDYFDYDKHQVVCVEPKYYQRNSETDQQVKQRFNTNFHHVRYIVVFLGGLSVGFMSLLRLNITVAIINMVNQTKIYLEEHPSANLVEYFGEGYTEVGEFDWNNEEQQTIISYYMIAYTLPQLLTTKLAIKLGAKWCIPLSLGLCCLSCLLTPVLAYYGWQYVTLLRLLNGLGASAILPIMLHVIEHWMPNNESSFGLAIMLFVQSLLFTVSPLVSGMLADIHWKWAFYAPALVALVFCAIWPLLVHDSPHECWFISQSELSLICGCNQLVGCEISKAATTKPSIGSSTRAVPWTRALRHRSFYALTLVWIFYQSSFGSFSFLCPSYLRQMLKVPIMENGMLCFMIQSGCVVSVIWPQPILEFLQRKCHLSLTAARRIVLAFICLVTATTMLIVAGLHQYQVILFAINRIFHLSTDTLVTSTIISQYSKSGTSSIVYSVINAIGNFTTVFFCMAVGEFLDISGQSPECWSWVFVSWAAMNVATLVLFSTVITSEPIELDEDRSETSSVDIEECRATTIEDKCIKATGDINQESIQCTVAFI